MIRKRLLAVLLAFTFVATTMGGDVECDVNFDEECDFFCGDNGDDD